MCCLGPSLKNPYRKPRKGTNRAVRFVTGNSTMEFGHHRFNVNLLGWPHLEERRLQTRLKLFKKARLNFIDIPVDH